jgi:hypothetical protein
LFTNDDSRGANNGDGATGVGRSSSYTLVVRPNSPNDGVPRTKHSVSNRLCQLLCATQPQRQLEVR